MEIVDNAIHPRDPGAMEAGVADILFWGSLAVALLDRRVAAFPANRHLIAHGSGHAVVHASPRRPRSTLRSAIRALRERAWQTSSLLSSRTRRRWSSIHASRQGRWRGRRTSRDPRCPGDARPRHARRLGSICGIAAFPGAVAAMVEGTAEIVPAGASRADPQRAATYGNDRGRAARRSHASRRSCSSIGPFVVETAALSGHTDDGTSFASGSSICSPSATTFRRRIPIRVVDV